MGLDLVSGMGGMRRGEEVRMFVALLDGDGDVVHPLLYPPAPSASTSGPKI